MEDKNDSRLKKFAARHPVPVNLIVILCVAVIGILIVYFSIALFTKHGQTDIVPGVENMSYTEAINTLHDKGFRVDIRDSLYKDNIRPGFVIEQYPKANSIVKPGRKIFLYINAVHPKEVVIDDDNHPMENALKSFSFRSGMAKLEELGFKNVKVVKVLGENEVIVKVLANGRPVKKMQKVPVNAKIVVEVYDGRLSQLRDSLNNEEYLQARMEEIYSGGNYGDTYDSDDRYSASETPDPEPSTPSHSSSSDDEEDVDFF